MEERRKERVNERKKDERERGEERRKRGGREGEYTRTSVKL